MEATRYFPFVIITIRFFPPSWLVNNNRGATRGAATPYPSGAHHDLSTTTEVPHVEQRLLTLPVHLAFTPVFSGVRVARSLDFCVMFCRFLFVLILLVCLFVCLIVLNATFNNISIISWRLVLLVEETGENHRPVASHWQTCSHNVVHLTLIEIRTHNISGDRNWLHR
jgi:hypothetical protein